jgi:hypothetical protein
MMRKRGSKPSSEDTRHGSPQWGIEAARDALRGWGIAAEPPSTRGEPSAVPGAVRPGGASYASGTGGAEGDGR